MDHPDDDFERFESDLNLLVEEILSSIDFLERQWMTSVSSRRIQAFLASYFAHRDRVAKILRLVPDHLKTASLEMFFRKNEATLEQLDTLVSFLPLDDTCTDGRIAEIAFLIRNQYLQEIDATSPLTISNLFPIPPACDFHTAIFVAKGLVDSGRLPESELRRLQAEFEAHCIAHP